MSRGSNAELNAWVAFDEAMLKLHRMYERGVPLNHPEPGCPMDRREQALLVSQLWREWRDLYLGER